MLRKLNKIHPLECIILGSLCFVLGTLGVSSFPTFSSYWAALKYHVVDNAFVTGFVALSFCFLALGICNCVRLPRRK